MKDPKEWQLHNDAYKDDDMWNACRKASTYATFQEPYKIIQVYALLNGLSQIEQRKDSKL